METLSELEAFDFLGAADIAHIAVVDMGEAYVTPMAFVLDERRILFRSGPGRRLAALRRHPVVSFEACYLERATGDWVSVIASGTAEELTDDLMNTHTVTLLMYKYGHILGTPLALPGLQTLTGMAHVIGVPIARISGVCSSRRLLTNRSPR
jgi:nitroimidazol reductase NimA-like FMN-containing flavoprotein (pyridoxamine 5'-phosphate oxidase superfamily)